MADRQTQQSSYDELLADALSLMDQHASEEVKMEARRRIIEREVAKEQDE